MGGRSTPRPRITHALLSSPQHSAEVSHHVAVHIVQRIPAGGRAEIIADCRVWSLKKNQQTTTGQSRRRQAKINWFIRCTVILKRLNVSAGGLLRAHHCKSITPSSRLFYHLDGRLLSQLSKNKTNATQMPEQNACKGRAQVTAERM